MLFKQIKYFLTIADSGSFSEAAAQCYISQSAVSQQINALENELGVRLLERLPRGIVLTDAGSFLYEHGRKVADAQKLKQGILTAAYKLNERLSVAYITGSVPEFLPQALCVFKKQHADVAVDVYGTGYLAAFTDLTAGKADLVVAGRSVPAGDYDVSFLYSAPYYAAISSMFKTGPQDFLSAENLKELPCIIIAENKEREAEQRYYRELFGVKNSFLVASNEEEAELMAAAGNGYMLTENANLRPGIQKVPFYAAGSHAKRRYYLYTDKCSQKYVQDFIQIMTRLCVDKQPGEAEE